MSAIQQQSPLSISGKYRFRKYEPVYEKIDGEWVPASLDAIPLSERKVLWEGPWIKNLVVQNTNHGTHLITQALIGLTTYPIAVTQGKIGTGTTPAADSDTDLEVPVLAGILLARQSATPTSAFMEFFISGDSLADGDYTEFGLFCGEQMFARSIISPTYSKSTNEDTGLEYIISIAN